MQGILPSQAVVLNEVPSSVLRSLNVGGTNARLENCVSGIYMRARNNENEIHYIRFDYASGRSKSHGSYYKPGVPLCDDGKPRFLGYFAIPYGTYLVGINIFYDADHEMMRGIQFVCNNNYQSKIYGCADADAKYEEQNICSDVGYMLTWLRFAAKTNHNDCAIAMEDDSCIQSPATPLNKKVVEQGLTLRSWSSTCAFYPRMSKFIDGTVAFELVHFPGPCFIFFFNNGSMNACIRLLLTKSHYFCSLF